MVTLVSSGAAPVRYVYVLEDMPLDTFLEEDEAWTTRVEELDAVILDILLLLDIPTIVFEAITPASSSGVRGEEAAEGGVSEHTRTHRLSPPLAQHSRRGLAAPPRPTDRQVSS